MSAPIRVRVETFPLNWLLGTSQERMQAHKILSDNWDRVRPFALSDRTQGVSQSQPSQPESVYSNRMLDSEQSGSSSFFSSSDALTTLVPISLLSDLRLVLFSSKDLTVEILPATATLPSLVVPLLDLAELSSPLERGSWSYILGEGKPHLFLPNLLASIVRATLWAERWGLSQSPVIEKGVCIPCRLLRRTSFAAYRLLARITWQYDLFPALLSKRGISSWVCQVDNVECN
jgi:hypothetical protein